MARIDLKYHLQGIFYLSRAYIHEAMAGSYGALRSKLNIEGSENCRNEELESEISKARFP